MTSEFNLIQKYFTRPTQCTDLGIGDDAALVQISPGHQLAISADMSVVGTHFFQEATPYNIGWKSLAVNVSDMAAMGANPKWATLSIALPEIGEAWLAEFSRGLFTCADAFNIDLIGGDTAHGPLNIAIQIMGEIPIGKALARSGAKAGDDIWVSGNLGSAALGLAHLQQNQTLDDVATQNACLEALHTPQPRINLGVALRELAHSCIDISDGLLADLGHILKASKVGATIQLEAAPCLPVLKKRLDESAIQQAILAGGDDYELCFTAVPDMSDAILALSKTLNLDLTKIGQINTSNKLSVTLNKESVNLTQLGYDHFSS
ncbi:MAG: thiamine-phosphate kinase [Methylophilaceae bacterium]